MLPSPVLGLEVIFWAAIVWFTLAKLAKNKYLATSIRKKMFYEITKYYLNLLVNIEMKYFIDEKLNNVVL